MSFDYYGDSFTDENLKAKINDMLCRIASAEDRIRELEYLVEEIQKKLEA